jgi:hypothetical protein
VGRYTRAQAGAIPLENDADSLSLSRPGEVKAFDRQTRKVPVGVGLVELNVKSPMFGGRSLIC